MVLMGTFRGLWARAQQSEDDQNTCLFDSGTGCYISRGPRMFSLEGGQESQRDRECCGPGRGLRIYWVLNCGIVASSLSQLLLKSSSNLFHPSMLRG